MLAFLKPFNVELSMTQKFNSRLFGSNILDTKAVCITFVLASEKCLAA